MFKTKVLYLLYSILFNLRFIFLECVWEDVKGYTYNNKRGVYGNGMLFIFANLVKREVALRLDSKSEIALGERKLYCKCT